ncbi:TonB-dependent receptor [Kordiimonas pumila]|uniref:TonB-dependent receptor n=1 Tax=Kordiimonas pumila TaxID=2161677 RepID=A0ABV7D804_9PROT|nr:TonB-dependent receptor [Kordiimonas pumila]
MKPYLYGVSALGLMMGNVPILAQANDKEDVIVMEEVVVTARFREQGVQGISSSIKAFGQSDLQRLGIVDTSDLVRFTPGLNMQERGPNRNEMNIRGVTNFLTTQDNLPSARPVGIYVDDVPVNTLGGSQVEIRAFDLRQVEVLRGPQGTLFGEGASAGAVRYFTQDPDLENVSGSVEAELTNVANGGEDFGLRAALNMPVVQEKLGIRIAGGRYASPGYVDVVDGDKDINDYSAYFVRGTVLFKPTDALKVRLTGTYDTSKLGSLGLITGDPSEYQVNLPVGDDKIKDNYFYLSGNIAYDFGSFVLTSITSYFDRSRNRQVYDQIYSLSNSLTTYPYFGVLDESYAIDGINYSQFSQEIRFVSQFDGPFQISAGAFYRDFEFTSKDGDVISNSYLLFGLPSNSLSESLEILGYGDGDADPFSNAGKQYSVFAEVEYSFNEQWKIIAGLRSHNETIDVFTPAATTVIFGAPFGLPEISEEVKISTLLPMAALEFHVNNNLLLYARYATGARNGNLNSPATLATMEVFAPGSSQGFEAYKDDRTETYELGLKSTLLDRKVTFNLAGFYTDYTDMQSAISVAPLGFGLFLNAGKARNIGVEAEINAHVNEHLRVYGGFSYIEAELGEDLETNQLTGAVLPKGTQLPNTPKTSFNFGGEYTDRISDMLEWYVNTSYVYTGDYVSTFSATAIPIGDFGILNAGFGVRAEDWSLGFYVSNLTNESDFVSINAFDNAFMAQGYTLPGGVTFNEQFAQPPRRMRLVFRYNF